MDPFLLLHPDDNVLVCRQAAPAGASLVVDGLSVALPAAIEVGHKIARCNLAPGDKVIKYGAPIGSMTAPCPRAGHVHLHNMQSDYISSHTREATGHDH
jgi:hypothetical protein